MLTWHCTRTPQSYRFLGPVSFALDFYILKNMTPNANGKLILPNKSLAGLKLGATKKALLKIWGDPIEIEELSLGAERLKYENTEFWLESNKITQIGVSNLYEGKTKDGIKLGSSREEVEKIHGSLSWDGTWHVDSPPFGIGFDFKSNLNAQQCVSEIFIFEEYY